MSNLERHHRAEVRPGLLSLYRRLVTLETSAAALPEGPEKVQVLTDLKALHDDAAAVAQNTLGFTLTYGEPDTGDDDVLPLDGTPKDNNPGSPGAGGGGQ